MNRKTLFGLCLLGGAAALMTVPVLAAEAPKRGGVFTFATTVGEPDSYDCHGATSVSSLTRLLPHYSTLLKIDTENFPEIAGDVAETWSVSADGLAYTFQLRPGVMFHDGSALTSADIKATYERLRNPPDGVVSARKSQFVDITSIDTPDNKTVVFRLGKPNASMATVFASPWNCIYSAKKLVEDPRYYSKNVLGTGPFKFVKHDAGAEWVSERFDKYFVKGLPYLDGLRNLNMTASAAVNALAAGQIHTIAGAMTEAEVERVTSARGDKVRAITPFNSMTLFAVSINATKPGLNDDRVRRALNLAIDRRGGSENLKKVTHVSGYGGFFRTGSVFARSEDELKKMPGYHPDMEANRAEARRLLAEAGQSDLKFVFTNRQSWAPLGIFLIDQWRQIGVTVTQDFPETKIFFEKIRAGNFDASLDAFAVYADDPDLQLSKLVSFSKNPSNYSRLEDPEYDALYEKQLRSTNPDERKKIVRQMEDRISDRAGILPLFWSRRFNVESIEVHGNAILPSFYAGMDLARVWLDK